MHVVGRALDVLSVYGRLGCDVGLQKTCPSGHTVFIQAGYLMSCDAECGSENVEIKEPGEVRLAAKSSTHTTRGARPPEFISNRLLKVTLELRGLVKSSTLTVAYVPAETENASNKHAFWTTLNRTVEEIPKYEQLLVLIDAKARTGSKPKRGGWGAGLTK